MKVYEQRGTITAEAGTNNQATLKCIGGLLRYLLVRSLTSTETQFQVTLTDYKDVIRKRYGFHSGELIDDQLTMPVSDSYTVDILNASTADTFYVVFGVQES